MPCTSLNTLEECGAFILYVGDVTYLVHAAVLQFTCVIFAQPCLCDIELLIVCWALQRLHIIKPAWVVLQLTWQCGGFGKRQLGLWDNVNEM